MFGSSSYVEHIVVKFTKKKQKKKNKKKKNANWCRLLSKFHELLKCITIQAAIIHTKNKMQVTCIVFIRYELR